MAKVYYETMLTSGTSYTETFDYAGSNPARQFLYEIKDGVFTPSQKSFELPLVFVGKSSASVVDAFQTMMNGATRQREDIMTINGWKLRCNCVGMSNVAYQNNGSYKLNARFVSNRAYWTKTNSSYTLNNSGKWENTQTHEAVSSILLPIGSYGFRISGNTLPSSEVSGLDVVSSGDTYKFRFGAESTTHFDVRYDTQTLEGGGAIVEADNLFLETPYDEAEISYYGTTPNTSLALTIYDLRVMPEW